MEFEMPFYSKIQDVKLDFAAGNAYLAEIWTTAENDKDFPKVMERISALLQAEGYVMPSVKLKENVINNIKRIYSDK